MWRCLHPLFHPAFTEHQLYSKHCCKRWEHKNESARVHPVNELSAEEALPTDQTVADFFCARVCACVHACTCASARLCVLMHVRMCFLWFNYEYPYSIFFQCKYILGKKISVKLRSHLTPPTTPSHRGEAVLENIRYLYFEAMETLVKRWSGSHFILWTSSLNPWAMPMTWGW